ncbi:MAG: hypothetical protein EU540_09155 [Promethearchaeota archaeon]|nr:MAG: hypothetical protein EU540_09155 [Candidatus Lokiarchaeota archaeon]
MEFLKEFIANFENNGNKEKVELKNFGVVYTPYEITSFIIKRIFNIYFNCELREKINKEIENIKILDPACGSGRFLISIANFLFNIRKRMNPLLNEFELKKEILKKNIYGIDIDKSACFISVLSLLNWLYSDHTINQDLIEIDLENLDFNNIDQITKQDNINLNVFNLDYLLEFDKDNSFDLIIGNPPYIENKRLKDKLYKKKLYKNFKTAYKLFDIAILFIEKSLEILKENSGYLSFILPNKFLSSDYGIKIRNLLLRKTDLREIINISSLPIFRKSATYPVILSFNKKIPTSSNEIIIKEYKTIEDIIKDNSSKSMILPQKLAHQFPSNVIPISGNLELVSFLYKNFKTFSDTFKDLKIIYRPYGFLKYSKYFDNITEKRTSEKDLLLLGTGNVGKYYINHKKRIKIAKRDFKVSFFNYKPDFHNIWENLSSEKIIFREIAKDLTCVYDPGIFTNITGLYFIRIPSLDTDELYCLLTILNSKLMDIVFKTLFGTLHMSGGFLRFNGSFIKRLPIPNKLPSSLSNLGKILSILSQLKYEIQEKPNLNFIKSLNLSDFDQQINFFLELTNSLVNTLYFDQLRQTSIYPLLDELFSSANYFPNINLKQILTQSYKSELVAFNNEILKSCLNDINSLYLELKNHKKLTLEREDICF